MKKLWAILCLLVSLNLIAQEDEKNWVIRGYVKDLFSANFAGDSITVDNLVHNRLNFKWFPSDNLNVKVELRNRLFWGETVKHVPAYGSFMDVNNDYVDLSAMTNGSGSVLGHTMIDRMNVEWYKNDWEVTVGRQRINWGVNLVWNPNDLFNAYSFFDFDYEERPGSDAIRIKRYTGVASSIELASNISNDFDEVVMAGMWKWNKNKYDYQLIAGKAQSDVAIGVGWAGNLKNAGFKGEMTYFKSYLSDGAEVFLASITVDQSYESSFYINGSILFNSGAPSTPMINQSVNVFSPERLTAKNLTPFRYSMFLQTSYSFHPLINGSLSTIYFPSKRDALYINPAVTFSVKSNLDLDFISQLYFDKLTSDYKAQAKIFFLRMKWSF